MKKGLAFLVALAIVAMPMAAKTILVNAAYNVHNDYSGIDDLHVRSIGMSLSFMKGEDSGIYAQVNPYFGLSMKGTSVVKFSDVDQTLLGANFLIGYGGDLNFGTMGILLGGGLFADLNSYQYAAGSTFLFSTGLGLGANFYFQPGEGNLVLNAGLMAAVSPWTFWSNDYVSDNYTDWGQSTINVNVGVGWRMGGGGSRSRNTGSSSPGGSGDDDW